MKKLVLLVTLLGIFIPCISVYAQDPAIGTVTAESISTEEYVNEDFESGTVADLKAIKGWTASTDTNLTNIEIFTDDSSNKALRIKNWPVDNQWPEYRVPVPNLTGRIKIDFDMKLEKLPTVSTSSRILYRLYNSSNIKIAEVILLNNEILVRNGNDVLQTKIPAPDSLFDNVLQTHTVIDTLAKKFTFYIGAEPATITWNDMGNTTNTDLTIRLLSFLGYPQNRDDMPMTIDNLKISKEFVSYDGFDFVNDTFENANTDITSLKNWAWHLGEADGTLSVEEYALDNKAVYLAIEKPVAANTSSMIKRNITPIAGSGIVKAKIQLDNGSKLPTTFGGLIYLLNDEGETIGEVGYSNGTTLYIKNGSLNSPVSITGQSLTGLVEYNVEFDTVAGKYTVWTGAVKPTAPTYYSLVAPTSGTTDLNSVGFLVKKTPNDESISKLYITELKVAKNYIVNDNFDDGSAPGFTVAPTVQNGSILIDTASGSNFHKNISGTSLITETALNRISMKMKILETRKNHTISLYQGSTEIGQLYFSSDNTNIASFRLRRMPMQLTPYPDTAHQNFSTFNAKANCWFDLNIEVDAANKKFTAWIGDKRPTTPTWQFLNDTPTNGRVTALRFWTRHEDGFKSGYLVDHIRVFNVSSSTDLLAVTARGALLGGISGSATENDLTLPYGVNLDEILLNDIKAIPYDPAAMITVKDTTARKTGAKSFEIVIQPSDGTTAASTKYINIFPFNMAGGFTVSGSDLVANAELNNGVGAAKPIALIFAIYDSDGSLLDITVEDTSIPARDILYRKYTFAGQASKSAKIMMWDSIGSLTPITAPITK